MSFEEHLKGTDVTLKLSPFYRYTTNQLVTVSLVGSFASAINAATQRTEGVELAVQKGDPSRNGLSGQLSYTYTNAKIKYSTLANGSNAIDVINGYITAFNGLTKAGGGSPWYCTNGKGPNGTNGPSQNGVCGPKQQPIANPYYGDSLQGTLDRNGWYDTYANNPPQSSPDTVTSSAISPNVFTGFSNFKHDRFTATVNAILNEGTTYGSPWQSSVWIRAYARPTRAASRASVHRTKATPTTSPVDSRAPLPPGIWRFPTRRRVTLTSKHSSANRGSSIWACSSATM